MIAKEKLHFTDPRRNLGLRKESSPPQGQIKLWAKSFGRGESTQISITLEIREEISMPAATLTALKPDKQEGSGSPDLAAIKARQ